MKTFIIAEAGANHDRDFDKAVRLIRVAAGAGADAVKFQLYTSKKLYVENTGDIGKFKDVSKLIESIEMPVEWVPKLMEVCEDSSIEFMCTPFDEESCDLLVSCGMKRIKIAAFESKDLRLVRHFASHKLPVVFSAGIGTSPDAVLATINAIRLVGNEEEITVLHCNSSYPTPFEDINLGQLAVLRELLSDVPGTRVGLSDHTPGILIPPIAVTHGASVIEKHFTLDRMSKGPDHPFAIEPDELTRMCRDIRRAEKVMGRRGGAYTHSESSEEMYIAQRSLVTSIDVKAGERFGPHNVTTRRPWKTEFMSAELFDEVVSGGVSLKDIPAGTPIRCLDITWKTLNVVCYRLNQMPHKTFTGGCPKSRA